MTQEREEAQLRELLQSVREKVEDTHWIKGHYTTFKGEKMYGCLVGLINHAAREQHTPPQIRFEAARRLLVRIRQRQRGAYYSSIESWNDRANRRREDVLTLLDDELKAS